MKRILTVCLGNICRSPLAQVALAAELPGCEVSSAGLSPMPGAPAQPLSVQIAQEHGLDLEAHRAREVSAWMCQQSDLILVMETVQKAELERRFPQSRGKIFRLGHYRGYDIDDPMGQPRQAFDLAWLAITQGVSDWVPRIRQLS